MLNPAQVFQQIAQAGYPGRVDFESGLTKHQFYISGGLLLYAISNDPYFSLDAYLVRKQNLGKTEQKQLRARIQEDGRPIEAVLEAMQLLNSEELTTAMGSLCREIAFDLFSWTEGEYSFAADQHPPSGALRVDLDLATLLDRGQQVHEKWQSLAGKVPKLEVVLHRTAQPLQASEVEISPEEWQILATVDDVRNLYEICAELSPNRLQILSRIARLLEKNLVEAADFKERSRPGSLGVNKGFKFSSIATTFRNLFSIFFERASLGTEAETARKLNLSMQAVVAKGYSLPAGLAFDPQSVFHTPSLLQSFCFSGQPGDLKSILRSLCLVLQQMLSELKEKSPAHFDVTATDMRAVLQLAEDILPDFHLSIHTTLDKTLQGDVLPTATRHEPAPAPSVSQRFSPPTPLPHSPPEPHRLEPIPLPSLRKGDFSEELTSEIQSLPEAEQITSYAKVPTPPSSEPSTAPSGEEETLDQPQEKPKRQAPPSSRDIPVPLKLKSKTAKPLFEPLEREEEPSESEDSASGEGSRKVLVGVLVSLLIVLVLVIGVGGYLLATDKKFLKQAQKIMHRLVQTKERP